MLPFWLILQISQDNSYNNDEDDTKTEICEKQ